MADEFFDVVDDKGVPTGERKHRKQVHKDGATFTSPAQREPVYLHKLPTHYRFLLLCRGLASVCACLVVRDINRGAVDSEAVRVQGLLGGKVGYLRRRSRCEQLA